MSTDEALVCIDRHLAANDLTAGMRLFDQLVARGALAEAELRVAQEYVVVSEKLGRTDAAATFFAGVDRSFVTPFKLVGEGLLALGRFERTGNPEEAAAVKHAYQQVLAREPSNPFALALAVQFFLRTAPQDPLALGLAWQVCRDRLPALEELGTREPAGLAWLLEGCAEVAFRSDRPGEGRRSFTRARALNPRSIAHLSWARFELNAGNHAAAAELFAAATRAPVAGDRVAANLGLGVARTRLHDRGGAERAYRDAMREFPAGDLAALPSELVFNLGVLLADSSEPASRDEARRLLAEYPRRADADEQRALRCEQLLLELGP